VTLSSARNHGETLHVTQISPYNIESPAQDAHAYDLTQPDVVIEDTGIIRLQSATLPDGGWVTSWIKGGQIYQQYYHADGTKRGEVTAVTNSEQVLRHYSTVLNDGSRVELYDVRGDTTTPYSVYMQRIDASGNNIGSRVLILANADLDLYSHTITTLKDGSYVIAYTSFPGSTNDVHYLYQAHYSASGVKIGSTQTIYSGSINNGQLPDGLAVVALEDGGWLNVYRLSSFQLYFQRFNASGVKVGSTTYIDTGDYTPYISGSDLPDGGWVLSLLDERDIRTIYHYNSAGVKVGTITINIHAHTTSGGQNIIGLPDNGWVYTWSDQGDIYYQRYDSNGATVGSVVKVDASVSGTDVDPQLDLLPDGGWLVSWRDASGIYQQRYDQNGNLVPVVSADADTPADDLLLVAMDDQTSAADHVPATAKHDASDGHTAEKDDADGTATDGHAPATEAEGGNHPDVTSTPSDIIAALAQGTEQLADGHGGDAPADGDAADANGQGADNEGEKPADDTAVIAAADGGGKADADATGDVGDQLAGATDNDQPAEVAEAGKEAAVDGHPETGDVQLAAADDGLNFEHIEASVMSGDHPATDDAAGAGVSESDPQLNVEALLPETNSGEIDLGQFGESTEVPTPSQAQPASAPVESPNASTNNACDMPAVSTPQILIDEPNHLVA